MKESNNKLFVENCSSGVESTLSRKSRVVKSDLRQTFFQCNSINLQKFFERLILTATCDSTAQGLLSLAVTSRVVNF